MFTSHLLRVLQIFPAHVNREDRAFDSDELKSTMKENPETDANPLASLSWNTPEFECPLVVDNFTGDNEDEKFRKSFAPHANPSDFLEKREFYEVKNVMECDLPELIVCYKENSYHVVKDICIDEGIPSENKALVDSNMDNHEVLVQETLTFSSGEDCYAHADIECGTTEKIDINSPIPDDGKDLCPSLAANHHIDMCKLSIDTKLPNQVEENLSSGKDFEAASAKQCGTKDKIFIDSFNLDEVKHVLNTDNEDAASSRTGSDGLTSSIESNTTRDVSKICGPVDLVGTSERRLNATDNLSEDASREQLVSSGMLSVRGNRSLTSLKNLLESDSIDDDVLRQEVPIDEVIQSPTVVSSEAEEPCNNTNTNDISHDSKAEGGTISFNFEAGASGGSDSPDNVPDLNVQSQKDVLSHTGKTPESVPISSQVQQHGEYGPPTGSPSVPNRDDSKSESFSTTGPVSGLITYSGPMAFSGSISLRSDSSTTSTRSFAFPILQSEWNSSPVRMAKADRRHYGKHRGWKHSLLCCRF